VIDRVAFRPLLGLVTALSFDVLAHCIEEGTPPERGISCCSPTLSRGSGWCWSSSIRDWFPNCSSPTPQNVALRRTQRRGRERPGSSPRRVDRCPSVHASVRHPSRRWTV